jgi:integrase
VPETEPTAFLPDELDRWFASAAAEPGTWPGGVPAGLAWTMAGLLCLDTGWRFGSLWAAETAWVDLLAGTIRVPYTSVKGRRATRTFRLHAQTVEVIARTRPADRGRLWPFPFRRAQVWYHLRRINKRAGLPTGRAWCWHCFRRTAESLAAAVRGVEFSAAAIGHTVAVARACYISPRIVPQPSLVDVLPRPTLMVGETQLTLF